MRARGEGMALRAFAMATCALAGAWGGSVQAQDIEAEAQARGLTLPAGYYRTLAENPEAFTFPHPWAATQRRAGPQRVPGRVDGVGGTFPLLVIPILYADSQDPLYDASVLQQLIFDGPAQTGLGTLKEFWLDASGGRLTVEGQVLPWSRSRHTIAEVAGNCQGLCGDDMVGEYLTDGLDAADPLVDFGEYDNDGPDGIPNSGDDDGFVDAVAFQFQEIKGSCGGPSIWPHRWGISGWTGGTPYTTQDPSANGGMIQVEGYTVQGVTDCLGLDLANNSTLAHEFGHILNLPDLYHPVDNIGADGRRWVVGCFGLMAAGSGWGCGIESPLEFGPTHLVPWSRDRLGWIEFDDAPADALKQTFKLEPSVQGGRALRVFLDFSQRESLVLEYRPQTGWDSYLPAGGVLVYHHDANGVTRPQPGTTSTYGTRLLEADGHSDLILTMPQGGNRGEASDVFGMGVNGPLNTLTQPSTRRYEGNFPSPVTIHSMEVRDGAAWVTLTATINPTILEEDRYATVTALESTEVRIPVYGGAMPYSAAPQGSTHHGMAFRMEGSDMVLEGEPLLSGMFDASARITDVLGVASTVTVILTSGEPNLPLSRLAAGVFDPEVPDLTPNERAFLDQTGNQNGKVDVGDLRAYLLRK